jgi:hypothetical protein
MPTYSETKKLHRDLRRHGYKVTFTAGGHVKITHPSLRMPVFAPGTPSDRRATANLLAHLRRLRRAAEQPPHPATVGH